LAIVRVQQIVNSIKTHGIGILDPLVKNLFTQSIINTIYSRIFISTRTIPKPLTFVIPLYF